MKSRMDWIGLESAHALKKTWDCCQGSVSSEGKRLLWNEEQPVVATQYLSSKSLIYLYFVFLSFLFFFFFSSALLYLWAMLWMECPQTFQARHVCRGFWSEHWATMQINFDLEALNWPKWSIGPLIGKINSCSDFSEHVSSSKPERFIQNLAIL